MKAEVENASAEDVVSVEMNSGSIAIGAEAGGVGATTTTGNGVRAMQQFA